jgi:uncharacterized cupin superfamily protein
VTHGTLTLLLDGERHPLRSGESAVFDADVDHAYRNEGARQAVRLIMFVITPDPPAGASRTVDRTPRATRAPRPRRTRGTGGGRQDEEE